MAENIEKQRVAVDENPMAIKVAHMRFPNGVSIKDVIVVTESSYIAYEYDVESG